MTQNKSTLLHSTLFKCRKSGVLFPFPLHLFAIVSSSHNFLLHVLRPHFLVATLIFTSISCIFLPCLTFSLTFHILAVLFSSSFPYYASCFSLHFSVFIQHLSQPRSFIPFPFSPTIHPISPSSLSTIFHSSPSPSPS